MYIFKVFVNILPNNSIIYAYSTEASSTINMYNVMAENVNISVVKNNHNSSEIKIIIIICNINHISLLPHYMQQSTTIVVSPFAVILQTPKGDTRLAIATKRFLILSRRYTVGECGRLI